MKGKETILITSDDAAKIAAKIAKIAATNKVVNINQVSTARFIENYIDETTDIIHFKNINEVTTGLMNLLMMDVIFINHHKKILRPRVIISSTTLSNDDFGQCKVTEINLEKETVASAYFNI